MQVEKKQKETISIAEELRHIEQLASEGPKVKVTENQLKVMANKYLRGDSVELWLRRIARNLALAEILYENKIPKETYLDGIKHAFNKVDYDEKVSMLLLHDNIVKHEERYSNFFKFENNLYMVASTNPIATKIVKETEEEFYNLLTSFDFLPNSPTLMNAGRDLQQLSACFREDQPIMTAEGIKPII